MENHLEKRTEKMTDALRAASVPTFLIGVVGCNILASTYSQLNPNISELYLYTFGVPVVWIGLTLMRYNEILKKNN